MSIDLSDFRVRRDDTKDMERIAIGLERATYLSRSKVQTRPPSGYTWEIGSIDQSDLRRAIAKTLNKEELHLTDDEIWLTLEELTRNKT